MSANTIPIFPATPKIEWGNTSTANTAVDGTGALGTAVVCVATAGTNGRRIDQIRVKHLGTNASATVLRFFINNGGVNTTSSNNSLVYEMTISTNTLSQSASSTEFDILVQKGSDYVCPIMYLPAGYRLLVTVGTAANLQVTAFGGDY